MRKAAKPNASPAFSARFTLPYQVHWHEALLPAGTYTINMASVQSPSIVQSTNGKISAFVFGPITDGPTKGAASLTIVTRGNERTVASLNMPSAGISLVYLRLTLAEQEQLAKACQVETVPLVVAKK